MVHDAARAQVGAVALAGLLLAGCFGSGGGEAPQNGPASRLAPPVQLASCRDWLRASPAARREIVASIKNFAGGVTGSPAGHGRTIPDDKAYELFDNNCRPGFARGFKLYKLYVRAAAFTR